MVVQFEKGEEVRDEWLKVINKQIKELKKMMEILENPQLHFGAGAASSSALQGTEDEKALGLV